MVIKRILCAALLLAGLMSSATVCAQNSQNTTRWTGSSIAQLSDGEEVFLYNVGTGRFLVHGGDWGTQARLFYNDSGKMLIFHKSGNNISFDTGMTTYKGTQNAKWLYCHAFPTNNDWNPSTDTNTYTIVMDGVESDGNWTLQQVTSDDGTYTYYMSQTTGNTTRWMGAAYGENIRNYDGDPNGVLALLSSSYDKAVWSTANPTGNTKYSCELKSVEIPSLGEEPVMRSMATEVQVFNADTKVPLRDLYKWRIVKKSDLLASMTSSDIGDGLSTNLTYLINDRGFERNDYSFFDGTASDNKSGWTANGFTDVNYNASSGGRYLYTWGYVDGEAQGAVRQTQYEVNNHSYTKSGEGESFMTPVRLKAQFDGKVTGNNTGYPNPQDQYSGKPEAKFGFMEFEGVGTASTYITAPTNGTGVYRISGYGFCQSNNNDAYFFATTVDPATLTKANFLNNPNVVVSAPLKKVSDYDKHTAGNYGTTDGKDDKSKFTGVIKAGYDFVYNKTDYRRELQISVTEGQKIYFGVVKLEATRTASSVSNYYYDSDWVGADQFDIVFLGTENAVWFDERNEEYTDNNDIAENIEYKNRAVRFHRTFAQGQWNSFVFPMNLTAVQVRHAFGDGTQVAVLHGLGTLSKNKEIIDFKSIALPAEGAAITAGQMYIIKPENGPLTSSATDPYGEEPYRTYYDMGNATFNSSSLPATPDDSYWVSDKGAGKGTADGATVAVKAHATYFNGTAIPAGSYVLGQHKTSKKYNMYYLTSGTTIKGFRGWITDDDSVLGGLSKSISINGVLDETDAIDGLTMDERLLQNGAIYDLSGRNVGAVANMSQLPKGLYIVNGKKYVVK